jgi:hypothetical protein
MVPDLCTTGLSHGGFVSRKLESAMLVARILYDFLPLKMGFKMLADF